MTDANANLGPDGNDLVEDVSVAAQPLALKAAPLRLAHVPRLSILLLLAWTAVTAVVLGVLQATEFFGSTRPMNPMSLLARALLAAAAGSLLFGSLFILWHKVRGSLWPLEPGEWLTLALTNLMIAIFLVLLAESRPYGAWLTSDALNFKILASLALVTSLLLAAIAVRRGRIYSVLLTVAVIALLYAGFSSMRFYLWPRSESFAYVDLLDSLKPWLERSFFGEVAAAFLIAAFALRRHRLWCAALVVPAIGSLSFYLPMNDFIQYSPAAERLVIGWTYGVLLITFGLIVAAVILDHRRPEPRHWLHFSGIVTSVVLLLVPLGMMTWAFFPYRQ